jgi:hypothetical protein
VTHYVARPSSSQPYDYRLPPDTFLSRRDPNWYIGASPATGHKFTPEVIRKVTVALVQMNASAKALADEFVRTSTMMRSLKDLQEFEKHSRKVFGESATLRWAENFTQSVESMVARLIAVGPSGRYPWENTPKLIKDVADFVETEGKFMLSSAKELTTVSGQIAGALRAVYQAVLDAASEALEKAAEAALELAGKVADRASKKPVETVFIAGGLLAALAIYFYVKR